MGGTRSHPILGLPYIQTTWGWNTDEEFPGKKRACPREGGIRRRLQEEKEGYFLLRVIERHVPGGRRDDNCDHGLSRRSSRVKPPTRYELGWKVKVMILKKRKNKKSPQ